MSSRDIDTHSDPTLDLSVYIGLIFLTAATLAVGLLQGGGRIMAVSIALIIASVKASLIGYYYMGLRRERGFMWAILGIGILAVLILLVGILPDLTFARL